MKTLVLQMPPTGTIAGWMGRCLDSVKSWAARKQFDYRATDQSAFDLCGPDYLARAGKDARSKMNLARLELIRDAHRSGYDRAVWVDADVLVFHPDLLTVDVTDRYAFARATWVTQAGERWNPIGRITDRYFVFMRGEPDLDALIDLTRRVGIHRKVGNPEQTGAWLINGLYPSFAFDTIDNVGRFSDQMMRAIAGKRDQALAVQGIGHDTPVFAASLCQADGDGEAVSDLDMQSAINRLIETRGSVVNRWLLESRTSLIHNRPKTGMAALFPLETNVALQYRQAHGHDVDLKRPRTFTERIVARKYKLVDDVYRITSDKLAVRDYIAERLGKDVLIPLLHVYERAEDLDFDALPDAFILKANHGSHWNQIVRDKSSIDRESVRASVRKWLASNYYSMFFEINYKDIPPRVLAERLLLSPDGKLPEDYRFYTFNGKVRVISASHNARTPQASITRFDPSWRRLAVKARRPIAGQLDPPPRLADMLTMAETLGKDFEFVRIDLYCLEGAIYFGEITHVPNSGLGKFEPRDFDAALGHIWESGEPIPERYYAKPA